MENQATPRRKDWHKTRQLILETFARMVVEDGVRDVSIQQVADRAGVAHRTVYRHFASRQELVDQLAEWLQRRGMQRGEVQTPIPMDALPSAIERNSASFEEDADLMKALVLATWESHSVSALQKQRTAAFRQMLDPAIRHLEPEQAQAVFALIRYLASSRTWLALREDHDVPGDQSGSVVGWVVELMINALQDGARPEPGGASRKEAHDDQ